MGINASKRLLTEHRRQVGYLARDWPNWRGLRFGSFPCYKAEPLSP